MQELEEGSFIYILNYSSEEHTMVMSVKKGESMKKHGIRNNILVALFCLLVSSQVLAASYDITAEYGAASGTGSFIYYDSNTNYHTVAISVKYFYKTSWNTIKNTSSSNLTHENNTWISATAGPGGDNFFSMTYGTEAYGYVDNYK